ncbi:hypothetical protein GON26_04260 [Flavobacterium sp. GA093]|uniref:Uncharacterized protein n=1 Tax=Flavobacterium hydrocarbonoxydans TaxID=2683249 RepID=A0A6I4NHA4_9FLAO|nr:hypothetical protein [Flavobacterium hydrocarbonoxydans]MWB93561.1 hypothetical protein [Flavobacterium hydrocarbonoxydans]
MKKLFIILIILCIGCKRNNEKPKKVISKPKITTTLSYKEQLQAIKKGTSKDSILSNDIQFINDSILKGKFKLDISNYEIESIKKECYPIRLHRKMFDEFYNEGFNNLGDLNGDKKADSVFVLHALNYCEEGDSYYFTDNNIPRIITDSNCCHPTSIINIGDIDEDGKSEIAEYYSSCASRYKAITIYSLKNNKWKEIKSFSFVLNDQYTIENDFKKLFKKISKNNLKYFVISDITENGKLVTSWEKIKIE